MLSIESRTSMLALSVESADKKTKVLTLLLVLGLHSQHIDSHIHFKLIWTVALHVRAKLELAAPRLAEEHLVLPCQHLQQSSTGYRMTNQNNNKCKLVRM